jgi:magnesium transporter
LLGKILQTDIADLIAARDFDSLKIALVELPPADVAEILIDLPDEDEAVVFRLLPRKLASDAFSYLPAADQEILLGQLSREHLENILNDMTPDDRTRLLEELPGGVCHRLLTVLSPEEMKVARRLLGYPEGSIGRLMTPEYVSVRPDWTVQQVLDHLRKVAQDKETLNVVYVVDEHDKLLDDLRLSQVVLADPARKVADLMDGQFVALSAFENREQAVAEFRKYGRVALPVTDSDGILLGIVTVDDVLEVAKQEADEDIQKFAGHGALDEPYFATGHWTMIRKRLVWLIVLLAGGMLTTTALESFQHDMQALPVLTLFFQMVIGSGGNSGTQSASLILRGLAVREIGLSDWWRVLLREIVIGLCLGVILAGFAYGRVRLSDGSEHAMRISLAVAVSLAGSVAVGSVLGAMLPMFFKRLGADPAVSSSPFITTLVDVTGILIYFAVANLLLASVLHP